MGQTAKALGESTTFVFGDETLELSPLTYADQAKFESWLEGRALAALDRQRPKIGEDEYRKRWADLIGDIASGLYSFGSENCAKAAKTIPGLKELFLISLVKKQPNITRQKIDEIFESKMREAADTMNAANSDPLATTPGEPAMV
jgi:hypothetical protein